MTTEASYPSYCCQRCGAEIGCGQTALAGSAEHIAVLRWHVERLLESGMASPGAQAESLSRALQWLDSLSTCTIPEDDRCPT